MSRCGGWTKLIHLLKFVIFQVFKEPLEKDPRGGSIISAEDIKTIFGRLPGILEVHNKIMVSYAVYHQLNGFYCTFQVN